MTIGDRVWGSRGCGGEGYLINRRSSFELCAREKDLFPVIARANISRKGHSLMLMTRTVSINN